MMVDSKSSTSTAGLSTPFALVDDRGTHTSKANLPSSADPLDNVTQVTKPVHDQKFGMHNSLSIRIESEHSYMADGAKNRRQSHQSTSDESTNEITNIEASIELEPEIDHKLALDHVCDPSFNLRGADLQIQVGDL